MEDPKSQTAPIGGLFSAPVTAERRRAEAWLQAQLARAAKVGVFTSEFPVEISPVLAELMLERNAETADWRNRRQRESKIAKHVDNIKLGRWKVTHQGIAFNSRGRLADGQHRLRAIVEAGRSVSMNVTFGQDPGAFDVIDTHASRGADDVLYIKGEMNDGMLSAACRLLNGIKCGAPIGITSYALDAQGVSLFLDAHPMLRECTGRAQTLSAGLKCAPTPLCVAIYLIREQGYDPTPFLDRLQDGLGLTSTRDPIYLLRDGILKKFFTRGATGNAYLAGAFIIAWNMYVAKKRGNSVRWANEKAEFRGFPAVTPMKVR